MAFQFSCPKGHLLEADESQQGRPCVCPECGASFSVPRAGEATIRPQVAQVVGRAGDLAATIYHIPCPRGHLLDAPLDMLGQEVMCPFCSTQFRLRYQDSQEAEQERNTWQERSEAIRAQQWMKWAITAAALVALMLAIMIAYSMSLR